jgi:gamma-butyrobetaine dioxygenase
VLLAAVSPDAAQVAVSFDGIDPIRLHALWLRDACRCGECRRPTTNERLLDSTQLSPELTITTAAVHSDDLVVVLSDHHEVRLSERWLRSHCAAHPAGRDVSGDHKFWPTPPGGRLQRFERPELDQADGLVRWIDAIWRDGAAVVSGVAPSGAGLRSVASLIGEIRSTNYGVTWEISATIAPVSAVESERDLRVHTDLPYRTEAPGIQLLLAEIIEVNGGASTLVDGYAAADELRVLDSAAWEMLTRVEFTYPYVRHDIEIHGRAPLIGLHRNGTYHEVRRAPDLVGVPIVDADEAPALYAALRTWTELLDDPRREASVALQAGDLLAFHNHRLLHGRTAFELGASGRRRLLGCYLDVDDLLSRRAVAARPA